MANGERSCVMHMVAKPIKVCMCITLGDADTSLSLVGLSKCVLGVRILAHPCPRRDSYAALAVIVCALAFNAFASVSLSFLSFKICPRIAWWCNDG